MLNKQTLKHIKTATDVMKCRLPDDNDFHKCTTNRLLWVTQVM